MQRVINYGSFLQAYALKKLLLNHGVEKVFFLDIKNGKKIIKDDPIKKIVRWVNVIIKGELISKLKNKKHYKLLKKQFEENFFPVLGINGVTDKSFDLAIIGSDEVFHCLQNTPWGFTTQLYGDIPEAQEVITYAASFGNTNYEMLIENNLVDDIKKHLQRIKAISVRDKNSETIIQKILSKKPVRHLDPVLISTFDDEIARCEIKIENYIVIYSYPGSIALKNEVNEIISFSREKKKKIISIYSYYSWADEIFFPDEPFEFLALIKNADYIISDTFHGSIFSIIFNKQFCTLIRPYNENKIVSLFDDLGLSDLAIYNPHDIREKLIKNIDYNETNFILEKERLKTSEYLVEHLK
jgi:hypothetical protein